MAPGLAGAGSADILMARWQDRAVFPRGASRKRRTSGRVRHNNVVTAEHAYDRPGALDESTHLVVSSSFNTVPVEECFLASWKPKSPTLRFDAFVPSK
jgi:hypothetical protein